MNHPPLKEIVAINKRWLLILRLVFVAFIVSGVVFFTLKKQRFDSEMSRFNSSKISGVVTELTDLHRGFYSVTLKRGNSRNRYELPNFSQYVGKIRVGDSLYKPAESMTFQLYSRTENGFLDGGILEVAY